jgi:hypothetical protein
MVVAGAMSIAKFGCDRFKRSDEAVETKYQSSKIPTECE